MWCLKKIPIAAGDLRVETFKKLTDWDVACVVYNLTAERSAANNVIMTDTPNFHKIRSYGSYVAADGYFAKAWTYAGHKLSAAKAVHEYLVAVGMNSAGGQDDPTLNPEKEQLAWQLTMAGYWSETDLTAYCKLNEIDINSEFIQKALKDNLDRTDREALNNWNEQIKTEEENTFQSVFRIIIVIFGIILTIWAVFLYLAYWVDRLNNFIEVDFVAILTFNKFRISEDETKCTYMVKNRADSKIRTVNHRAILFICGVMIGTGVLMVTGLVYKLVFWIVGLITGIFKQ